nr:hypothetical protein [Tanacetum cinerariifolium]
MFADVNKSNAEYTKDKSNDEDNEDSYSAEEEQNTEDSERVSPRNRNDELKKKTIGSKRKRREYKVDDDDEKNGTKKMKKKSKIYDENNKNSKIRTRTTPTALFNALAILNGDRKKCLDEMGFGSMIEMGIHELPGKLESLEPRSPDDPFIKEWLSQFGDKNEVRPNDITDMIVSTKDAGKLFKINFLMLFVKNQDFIKMIQEKRYNVHQDLRSVKETLNEGLSRFPDCKKLNKLVKKFEEDFKKKDLARNDENDDTTATTNDKNDLLHFDSKIKSDSHASDDDNQNSIDDDGKQDVMDEIDKQNKEDICKEDNGDQTVEHNDSNEDTGNTDSTFVDIRDEHNNDGSEHSNNADAKSEKEDEKFDALAITICNVCHPVPLHVLMPNENLKDFSKIINIEDSESEKEEFDFGGDTDNEEKY